MRFNLQTLITTVSDFSNTGIVAQPPEEGVVRVSLVHYNTVEEVERIVHVLADILCI